MKLREEPCNRCGWRYPGFHVCVDLSKPEPKLPPEKKAKKRAANKKLSSGLLRGSPEWREQIRQRAIEHAAKVRESNKARNDIIISHYNDGLSIPKIAQLMGLTKQLVNRVLLVAEKEGLVSIRRYVQDKDRDERIIKLYSEGGTIVSIAKALGHGEGSVTRVLHKAQKAGKITIRMGRPRKKV